MNSKIDAGRLGTALESYFKAIRNLLSCPEDEKRRILTELESGVDDYLEDNPDAGISDITQHFGVPESFQREYIVSLDNDEIVKKLEKRKFIKRALIIIGAIVIAITAIMCIKIAYDNSRQVRRVDEYNIIDNTTKPGSVSDDSSDVIE